MPFRGAPMRRGERLKSLRAAKQWNQADVARAVAARGGLFKSTSYVCKLERGAADRASAELLEVLAEALEIPKDTILAGSYDAEIAKNSVDFVTRQSLEAFIAARKLPPDEAANLRSTYQRLRDGARDVTGWSMIFAYATALVQMKLKKPGAKMPASTKRLRAGTRRAAS